MANQTQQDPLPYSYHTLLYPFTFSHAADFERYVELVENMDLENAQGKAWVLDGSLIDDTATGRLNYNTYQYFTPAARRALMLDGKQLDMFNPIVRKYYRREIAEAAAEGKACHYILTMPDKKEFDLMLLNVRLMVFRTGVGVLIYEMSYSGEGDPAPWDTVKLINEYARRVFPAYIGSDSVPEKIVITKDPNDRKNSLVEEKISDPGERAEAGQINHQKFLENPDYIIKTISWLLPKLERESIRPAIDDRMFVCSLVRDKARAKKLVGTDTARPNFMVDMETAQDMYSFANIDKSTSYCTCSDMTKLRQDLNSQIYRRWTGVGSFHAVTPHSFMCLTGEDEGLLGKVINPFRTMYVYMAALVIAQRASLILMDANVTNAINQGRSNELNDTDWERLRPLEAGFAIFQGELLLEEVTPQIQGVELYRMLQQHMDIENLNRNVQAQLNNLYEIAENVHQAAEDKKKDEEERRENSINYILTAFAVTESMDILLTLLKESIPCLNAIESSTFSIIELAVTLLIILLVICWYRHRKKNKDRNKDSKKEKQHGKKDKQTADMPDRTLNA